MLKVQEKILMTLKKNSQMRVKKQLMKKTYFRAKAQTITANENIDQKHDGTGSSIDTEYARRIAVLNKK
jgi:hypothetical protein